MTSRWSLVWLVLVCVLLTACEATAVDPDLVRPGGADDAPGAADAPSTDDAGGDAQPIPEAWPDRVELGMSGEPGDAPAAADTAPFGFRYQYLAGGVNTGDGWMNWNPDGAFVTSYIEESRDVGILPVFTYYMLYQSSPGRDMDEVEGVAANLSDADTMAAYYRDLRRFFERAGEAGGTTVLHVEPDLWAYVQQRASNDDPATVPVEVDASGVADVSGLPDTAAGFARAIVRLRDRYAPDVLLGYHFSTWATGVEILSGEVDDDEVRALGGRTARFYESLGAGFDIGFTDIADRDAAFKEEHYGDGGASWMDDADYRRSAVYIDAFVGEAGIRAVLWQLPYGNMRMRAVDNTWGHYQDNKVETLLGGPGSTAFDVYTEAGVVAFLFGGGADGTTCACDAQGDGVTDPAPINGNDRRSLSADDDGGYFRERAAAYYRDGPVPLAD